MMAEDLASDVTDKMFALFEQGSSRDESIELMSGIMQKMKEFSRKERLTAEARIKDSVLDCKIAPSAITWHKIQNAGMVPNFEGFIMDINRLEVKKEIPTINDAEMVSVASIVRQSTELVLNRCASRNEAYSMAWALLMCT